MKKLIGSEKKIAWAEKIRANMIANLQDENRLFWGGCLDGGADIPKILGRSVCEDRLDAVSEDIDDVDESRSARRTEIIKRAEAPKNGGQHE